jgi:DNA gyrase/topoisomerase IV subunit B
MFSRILVVVFRFVSYFLRIKILRPKYEGNTKRKETEGIYPKEIRRISERMFSRILVVVFRFVSYFLRIKYSARNTKEIRREKKLEGIYTKEIRRISERMFSRILVVVFRFVSYFLRIKILRPKYEGNTKEIRREKKLREFIRKKYDEYRNECFLVFSSLFSVLFRIFFV